MDVAEIVIYALLALWAALAVRGVLAVAYQKSPLAIHAMRQKQPTPTPIK
jgi:hypothetical protein